MNNHQYQQFQTQLIALCTLFGNDDMKLTQAICLDSTPLATLKQIQLQTLYDQDPEMKILQQRAKKLNNIIRNTLQQYHYSIFTQTPAYEQQKQIENLRNLLRRNQYQYCDKQQSSSAEQNSYVEKKKKYTTTSRKQQINHKKEKIQPNFYSQKIINNENFQHQNIEAKEIHNKYKAQDSLNRQKSSKSIKLTRNFKEIAGEVKELKRPEYHSKIYTMQQYLKQFHDDQTSNNVIMQKNKNIDQFNSKIQQNLSRILEHNLTPRSSAKLSVTPKVQGRVSLSPINKKSLSRVEGKKFYNETLQIKSKNQQSNNLKFFYKTKNQFQQANEKSNKQQILVKLQQSSEMRHSLDNIASVIEKNSRNFQTLNSSMLGIKQAISQNNESKLTLQSQVFKQQIEKIIQKSRLQQQKTVKNYTVSQQQIWQCEQQQLEEQIKKIDKQLSTATLQRKYHQQQQTQQYKKIQKVKQNSKKIGNPKQISGAKLIKVDLTPQKNTQPAKISIDISSKIQKYQARPKHSMPVKQQNDSDELICKKWQKDRKQLLTMKIANLRN